MNMKKISSVLSLFVIVQPMIQNNLIFAKEVHNSEISENKVKNLDEKNVGKKSESKKAEIKKKNYKKIATIATLSTLLLGGAAIEETIAGMNLYWQIQALKFEKGIAEKACPAKYMDTQSNDVWCQFYAFQGLLNKELGIKPKVTDDL